MSLVNEASLLPPKDTSCLLLLLKISTSMSALTPTLESLPQTSPSLLACIYRARIYRFTLFPLHKTLIFYFLVFFATAWDPATGMPQARLIES